VSNLNETTATIELKASHKLNFSKLTRIDDQKSELNENKDMIRIQFGLEHRLVVIFEVPPSTLMLSTYSTLLQL
jgi:hypothetical protein